jgi:hypothetical protein
MRTLLLLLITLLAGSAAAQDSASSVSCKYDDADCRDGCTIDYGGSSRNYDKLGACLKKCKREYDRCLERQFSLEKEKLEKLEKEKLEKEKLEKEKLEKEKAESMSVDGGTPGADGGTLGTDGGTEPKPSKPGTKASGSKQPELEDTSELDRLFDEQQSPPPPPKSK